MALHTPHFQNTWLQWPRDPPESDRGGPEVCDVGRISVNSSLWRNSTSRGPNKVLQGMSASHAQSISTTETRFMSFFRDDKAPCTANPRGGGYFQTPGAPTKQWRRGCPWQCHRCTMAQDRGKAHCGPQWEQWERCARDASDRSAAWPCATGIEGLAPPAFLAQPPTERHTWVARVMGLPARGNRPA